MTTKKGFTLIELLVVISIISLLSSVVIVSASSSRKKGQDGRVISNVLQVRNAFELARTPTTFNSFNPHPSPPASNSNDISLNVSGLNYSTILALTSESPGLTYRVNADASGNVTAYAIYGKLVSNPNLFFCIDSAGKSNKTAGSNTTTLCPQ